MRGRFLSCEARIEHERGLSAAARVGLEKESHALARRQRRLEDTVLQLMERQESARTRVKELADRMAGLEDQLESRNRRLAAELAELSAESAKVALERETEAGSLPSDLLHLYEAQRAHHGSVGAAMLRDGRCGGCRLELTVTELRTIRAAEPAAVVRCEHCGRILVRTRPEALPRGQ
ncbi:zinc ribbon domain-containing protein [Streptomyces sp. NPDC058548]|uniref:zinc ribbon domain-containing protein n=1 Tax=unclassified Streptomyces TaxID=2593676 RepID=UPI0036672D51